MTPEPEPRGREPLRDQLFAAFCYALAAAALLAYALAPVSDDLGPIQALALSVPLTPACLAAIRWRAHRTGAKRAHGDREIHQSTAAPARRERDGRAVHR